MVNTKTYVGRVLNEDDFEGTVLALFLVKQGSPKHSWGYSKIKNLLLGQDKYLYTEILVEYGDLSKSEIDDNVRSSFKRLKHWEKDCPKLLDRVYTWEEVGDFLVHHSILPSGEKRKTEDHRMEDDREKDVKVKRRKSSEINPNEADDGKRSGPSKTHEVSHSKQNNDKDCRRSESRTSKKPPKDKVFSSKAYVSEESSNSEPEDKNDVQDTDDLDNRRDETISLQVTADEMNSLQVTVKDLQDKLEQSKSSWENEKNNLTKELNKVRDLAKIAQRDRDVAVMEAAQLKADIVSQLLKQIQPNLLTKTEFYAEIKDTCALIKTNHDEFKKDMNLFEQRLITLQQSVLTEGDVHEMISDVVKIKEIVQTNKNQVPQTFQQECESKVSDERRLMVSAPKTDLFSNPYNHCDVMVKTGVSQTQSVEREQQIEDNVFKKSGQVKNESILFSQPKVSSGHPQQDGHHHQLTDTLPRGSCPQEEWQVQPHHVLQEDASGVQPNNFQYRQSRWSIQADMNSHDQQSQPGVHHRSRPQNEVWQPQTQRKDQPREDGLQSRRFQDSQQGTQSSQARSSLDDLKNNELSLMYSRREKHLGNEVPRTHEGLYRQNYGDVHPDNLPTVHSRGETQISFREMNREPVFQAGLHDGGCDQQSLGDVDRRKLYSTQMSVVQDGARGGMEVEPVKRMGHNMAAILQGNPLYRQQVTNLAPKQQHGSFINENRQPEDTTPIQYNRRVGEGEGGMGGGFPDVSRPPPQLIPKPSGSGFRQEETRELHPKCLFNQP